MDPNKTFPTTLLSKYIKELTASQLQNKPLQDMWQSMLASEDKSADQGLRSQDMVVVDIRASSERIDTWQEEVSQTMFNLCSNLGGTISLCTGISFLSSFFLLVFCGRALFHFVFSILLWIWWALYLGKPPPLTLIRMNSSRDVSQESGDEQSLTYPEAKMSKDSPGSTAMDKTEIRNDTEKLKVDDYLQFIENKQPPQWQAVLREPKTKQPNMSLKPASAPAQDELNSVHSVPTQPSTKTALTEIPTIPTIKSSQEDIEPISTPFSDPVSQNFRVIIYI